MEKLKARNGLAYSVNLVFLVPMNENEFQKFNVLFGNLVNFVEKINDEGIIVHFTLNINEELSKFGEFKDVPSKTEIKNYIPLIKDSEVFLNSDINFLIKTIELYRIKENFNKNLDVSLIKYLEEKIKKSIDNPYIQIRNLKIIP
ncbi:hypothetical protein KQI88_04375 [Alkaliphilus sp. MSJ-5]|uniref:Uncharacterized protein n=1 Tax=Alkaliphilus flagellatus TaxID=2841507 RepID=A0ABS6FZZ8_9FIRM|nr:hypothetical protein [Alkaliphilus flagellatus]MBU5675644.1 hypothetical protein [Alkaliphilus flagellatus]